MTKAAIKQAFRQLDPIGQAHMLRELAATLAESLADEDKADLKKIGERQHEEADARSWREVRAELKSTRRKRRISV